MTAMPQLCGGTPCGSTGVCNAMDPSRSQKSTFPLPTPDMRMYEGIQSALSPQGPHAAVIAEISWVLISGATLIFGIVIAIAAYAIFARRERAVRLREAPLIVGGGIIFPVVALSALLIYTVVRAGSLERASGETPIRIEVTGEQWWWRVRRSEEHTSELQSQSNLVCRLLL